jgi:hypothetical protein
MSGYRQFSLCDLSKTNKYKTKQTNQKYQKERQKPNMNAPFINLT